MRLIDPIALKESIALSAIMRDGKSLEKIIDEQPPIQPEPHWIPCSERLPEKEGYYLITKECLGVVVVDTRYYYTERDSEYWSPYESGTVIAWLPLPEPYDGVTT